ncbi:MAG: ATP-dependent Clp protease proteolytic subunit 1 [Chlamydiia bacterium]|nr:ATP-dependent Clp protease proteolytic subunit 1 [Chlamydiia bacterium]
MSDETGVKEEKGTPFAAKIDEVIMQKRRIFLCQQVDDKLAKEVIRQLWYYESVDPTKPIVVVINSPGGSVDSGFAIWDQMKMISSPIITIVCGLAASMGSVLSLAGDKGCRFATPNSRIMMHQPLIAGTIQGQATDLEIQANEILKTRAALVKIYAEASGKSEEEIDESIDRDRWFGADEALEFGLLDKVINSYNDLPGDVSK